MPFTMEKKPECKNSLQLYLAMPGAHDRRSKGEEATPSDSVSAISASDFRLRSFLASAKHRTCAPRQHRVHCGSDMFM